MAGPVGGHSFHHGAADRAGSGNVWWGVGMCAPVHVHLHVLQAVGRPGASSEEGGFVVAREKKDSLLLKECNFKNLQLLKKAEKERLSIEIKFQNLLEFLLGKDLLIVTLQKNLSQKLLEI